MSNVISKLFKTILVLSLVVCTFLMSSDFFLPQSTKKCFICEKVCLPARASNSHEIPRDLEEAFSQALMYFPDLLDTKIQVVFDAIPTTMRAQPKMSIRNLLAVDKEFVISINVDLNNYRTVDYTKMPKDVLVGWLAHELGHIVDYKKRSTISLLGLGINYSICENFRREVEYFAQEIAIYRGAGHEILDSITFALEKSSIPNDYKKRLSNYYLSKELIIQIIDSYERECIDGLPITMRSCPCS
jgi:hypothetical protein